MTPLPGQKVYEVGLNGDPVEYIFVEEGEKVCEYLGRTSISWIVSYNGTEFTSTPEFFSLTIKELYKRAISKEREGQQKVLDQIRELTNNLNYSLNKVIFYEKRLACHETD